MLITCPNCTTSYQIESSSLGQTGRSVRCIRCGQTWFAANTAALSAIAEDHRAALAAWSTTGNDEPPAGLAADPTATAPPSEPPTPTASEFDWSAPDPTAADPTATDPAAADPPAVWSDLAPEPEPIQIANAPGLVPDDATAPALPGATAPRARTESVAARRYKRPVPQRSRLTMPGLTGILALVAINLGLIGWRADIVRMLPQTASLYAAIGLPVNLRGLNFADVQTQAENQDGAQLLMIEGKIVNATTRVLDVPRLRFSVRNQQGLEIYTWTAIPPKSLLAPNEVMPFRSRFASPPPESHRILVRFLNRRDLVAGIK